MARTASTLGRHPRHVALASFAAGLVLSGAPSWLVAAAAIGAGLGALSGRPALSLAAAALALAGCWLGGERREAIDRTRLAPHLGHAVVARGQLVKRERPTRYERRARVRLTALRYGQPERGRDGAGWRPLDELVQLRAGGDVRFPAIDLGAELELEGVLERPVSMRGGDFDYAAYLRRAGVHAVMRADSIAPTGARRRGPAGFVDDLRRRAEAGVAAGVESRTGSLARGIVLGEDERIPAAMVEQFKDSGLAHLLAVSGQNVTLLAILALPLLALLGFGRRARLVFVLGLIALYVPLTGAGPSVLRAGAMGAAATVAALSGRPASRWYALLLATAFTLVLDPRCWLDPGWQLSFAAVIGIFALVRPFQRRLAPLPPVIAEGAAITLAATIATAPLMALHFERLSVVSVLANLVALPAVAPIMWLGMLAAAFSQVSLELAMLVNGLNGYFLAYLAAVARWSAGLPHAVVSVRLGSPTALALAYAGIAAVFLGGGRILRGGGLPSRRARAALVALVTAALICVGLVAWKLRSPAPPPDRFTVSFLDVGQGDATLIQDPAGTAVLVDGGPAGGGIVGKLRRAGVRSLDLAVLTHPQADHEDGLEAVARKLPIEMLLDGGWGASAPAHRRIVRLLRRRGTRIVVGRAGQELRAGAVRLEVLSPRGGFHAGAGKELNDRALVILASYRGMDVFLPADAESDVTAALPLAPVEVLKVAHHGSEDPGLAALLDRLEPELAVIEVGAGNRYGHPSAPTLRALEARVPRVYRTDRDGDVILRLGSEGPVVATAH